MIYILRVVLGALIIWCLENHNGGYDDYAAILSASLPKGYSVQISAYKNVQLSQEDNCIIIVNPYEKKPAGLYMTIIPPKESSVQNFTLLGKSLSNVIPNLRMQVGRGELLYKTAPVNGDGVISYMGNRPLNLLLYAKYGFRYCLSGIRCTGNVESNDNDGAEDRFEIIYRDMSRLSPIIISQDLIKKMAGISGNDSFEVIAAKLRSLVYMHTKTGLSSALSIERNISEMLAGVDQYGLCNNMAEMYSFVLTYLGFDSRIVRFEAHSGSSHTAVEVKNPEADVWLLSDPTFNAYFRIENKQGYKSVRELKEAVQRGEKLMPVYWSDAVIDDRRVENYYVPYEELLDKITYP